MNSRWNAISWNRLLGAKLAGILLSATLLATLIVVGVPGFAQEGQREARGRRVNEKVKPFKIIGNVYYVGMSDQTVLLITTPEGNILIDSTWERMVPWIRESIEALGYSMRDVKILLNSHAHPDHVEGHSLIKELTGAQVVMSEADGEVLASGGVVPGQGDGRPRYKPVKPDRIIRNGDQVTLGGVTLTAHVFPGHTRGATTWTMVVEENGRRYNVVFWGGIGGIRQPFVNNTEWPTIVEEYTDTLRRAKALPCDIYTGTHGAGFGLLDKMRRLEQGEQPNPFYDPEECRSSIERRERDFREQLERERAVAR